MCAYVFLCMIWTHGSIMCVCVCVCICEREYQTHSSVSGKTQNKFKIYVDSRTTVSV